MKEIINLYRKTSRVIAKQLLRVFPTLTPNQVTIIRLIFIPCSVVCFLIGGYLMIFLGIVFFHLFILFDYVDGAVAYLRSMVSNFGCWLDAVVDLIGYSCIQIVLIWVYFNPIICITGIFVLVALFMNELFPPHESVPRKDSEKAFSILQRNTSLLTELFFSYGYLVTIFVLIGQVALGFFIMAIANNFRWIYLLYYYKPSFYLFKGKTDIMGTQTKARRKMA